MKENKRFNRRETATDHYYYTEFGTFPAGTTKTQGRVKLRLLHGKGYSLIVPDFVFVGAAAEAWIQPLAFTAVLLVKESEDDIQGRLQVDVSCRQTISIHFAQSGFRKVLPDGSQLFDCEITGPANLLEYATGRAKWTEEGNPLVELFHHTTAEAKQAIMASGHFRTSRYNIQGAQKLLANVNYAYFTPLDRLTKPADMQRVAMDIKGKLVLGRDGFKQPVLVSDGWEQKFPNDVLVLPVYESNPAKREASIAVWIDPAILAPTHIYRHDDGKFVYYEFPHYFIQRIGMEPGRPVKFGADQVILAQPGTKNFEYAVVGDCTTLEGLAAPYDEEDTTHILKLERPPSGMSILQFWFQFGNTDHFTGKAVALQEFDG